MERAPGIIITATNKKGKTLTGSGETNGEAYTKLIDNIDQVLDIPWLKNETAVKTKEE